MNANTTRVLYPGSFDPVTLGHVDIIQRALKLFDDLIIGVSVNTSDKTPMFDINTRVSLVKKCIEALPTEDQKRIHVKSFDTLLAHFARKSHVNIVIRGLRALSDFEYEFQMTSMTRTLDKNIETIFLTANEKYHFVSSRLIKEVVRLGGDASHLVPPHVHAALTEHFKTKPHNPNQA